MCVVFISNYGFPATIIYPIRFIQIFQYYAFWTFIYDLSPALWVEYFIIITILAEIYSIAIICHDQSNFSYVPIGSQSNSLCQCVCSWFLFLSHFI